MYYVPLSKQDRTKEKVDEDRNKSGVELLCTGKVGGQVACR